MAKPMNAKTVKSMLKNAGFLPKRSCASHTIYAHGSVTISVPDGHCVISPGVMRKITNAIAEVA